MEALVIVSAVAVITALSLVQRHQRRSRDSPVTARRSPGPRTSAPYLGDFTGRVEVRYSPSPDGQPDPGEIVWTWVPFEEGHSRGKDRPVLLIGRDGTSLLGIQLSSQDHRLDAAQEARHGRHWLAIGAGPWDTKRRASAVRLDRIVRVDPAEVRREGAMLNRRTFAEVSRSLSKLHHW